ncbi:hypothetical protein SAMN05421737_11431 [Shouchella lonarensis]|uniref:Uncharacterized protein n=1 Tax=Shouchella lonarensis TaxID=1464122 RepID=A0A1G6NZN9_9BACI|nr:hypothetical protein SAMN05421737_11431 [Shouchella lonarensis]
MHLHLKEVNNSLNPFTLFEPAYLVTNIYLLILLVTTLLLPYSKTHACHILLSSAFCFMLLGILAFATGWIVDEVHSSPSNTAIILLISGVILSCLNPIILLFKGPKG